MLHVVVNPKSQSGRTGIAWRRLEKRLKEKNIEYEVIKASSAKDLMDQIRLLTQGETGQPADGSPEPVRLLAIGGDGTLNDVVNAIGDFSRTRLGFIPSGSGNDFARDLGLKGSREALLDTILEDRVRRRLDVGTIVYEEHEPPVKRESGKEFDSHRRFAVSAGIGFDAAVCAAAEESPAKKVLNRLGLGKLIYLFMAVRVIIRNRDCGVELVLDDTTHLPLKRCLLAAFMNHRYEGGGFKFAPNADAADGILNVCIAGEIPRRRFFVALPFALAGKHYRFEGVDAYTARKITVKSEQPLWVHTDGETEAMASALSVGVLQGVLQMLD